MATTDTCPHCGQRIPKPRQAKTATPVDVAAMSESELLAYYKRISPVEDVKFHLRLGHPPAIAEGFRALLAQLEANRGKATTATKQMYAALLQALRQHHVEASYTYVEAPIGDRMRVYYRGADKELWYRGKDGKLVRSGVNTDGALSNCIIYPVPAEERVAA